MAESARRVVLAIPASAHGRPQHREALEATRRAFPGCDVVGPERRWDTILTPVAARAKLGGAHAFVFGAWEGRVSRGIFEMARAAGGDDRLGGRAYFFDAGTLHAAWTFRVLPAGERTRRHYAEVRAEGRPPQG